MKLSEAILLGSTLKPQIYGTLIGMAGTCALGAALEAIGATSGLQLIADYPWLLKPVACPEAKCVYSERADYIIATHLNDRHRWSRERIADWVASIEPPEEECTNGVADPVAHSERAEVFNL